VALPATRHKHTPNTRESKERKCSHGILPSRPLRSRTLGRRIPLPNGGAMATDAGHCVTANGDEGNAAAKVAAKRADTPRVRPDTRRHVRRHLSTLNTTGWHAPTRLRSDFGLVVAGSGRTVLAEGSTTHLFLPEGRPSTGGRGRGGPRLSPSFEDTPARSVRCASRWRAWAMALLSTSPHHGSLDERRAVAIWRALLQLPSVRRQ
jgi:hypothetical protein